MTMSERKIGDVMIVDVPGKSRSATAATPR